MTDWKWELKVYDVSTDKWISGIEQDLIVPLNITRSITDTVGEFSFDFDTPTTSINNEDVIIVNAGPWGSNMSRWFVGKVSQVMQNVDEEDTYLSINGKGIDGILLKTDAPEASFSSTAQSDIIKAIVADLEFDYGNSTAWVSSEPVWIEEFGTWQDLAVDEITSGSWTVIAGGSTKTYGDDYTLDLGGATNGRIQFNSGQGIRIGSYAYVTYETDRARPYGELDGSGVRQFKITTSSVVTETEALDINLNGLDKLGALHDVCTETTLQYDFWLDTDMDLKTAVKGSGTIHTIDFDQVEDLSYYEDSSYILNATLVKQAGGGNYDYWPNPIDDLTEFDGTPEAKNWSTMAATEGVFQFTKFESGASIYGGKFVDDYDVTPTLSVETSNVAHGNNYLRATTGTNVYVLRIENNFSSSTNAFGTVNIRNLVNFYSYSSPYYDDVISHMEAGTDLDNRIWTTFTLEDAFGTEPLSLEGSWMKAGDPNYGDFNYLGVSMYSYDKSTMTLNIDGLFFGRHPIEATAEDTTSQQLYGLHRTNGIIPYPVIDNTITTVVEAQQRANSIINLYKDPIPILERVTFSDGQLAMKPGDKLQLETSTDGVYFPTTRVVSITHSIQDDDIITEIECKSSSPSGIESYMQELELEIRRLEMREV